MSVNRENLNHVRFTDDMEVITDRTHTAKELLLLPRSMT